MSSAELVYIDKEYEYRDFYENILKLNKPCILSNWATRRWKSVNEWVHTNGGIDDELLFSLTNAEDVPVADCGAVEFGSHPKTDMTLTEYSTYWKQFQVGKDKRILYLKDWHFFRENPDYEAYTTPVYFSSDWMNEFWDFRRDIIDDFRFVYVGPRGTWTPLHADVYRSYSWSANICGEKRWLLFPPGEEEKLRGPNGKLPFDVRTCDLSGVDVIDVVQKQGEVMFVPSAWFHQVMNVTDCVSVNHNWLNACNVMAAWRHLIGQLEEVEESTADVADTPGWAEQCQICLKAYAGINYREFYVFIKFILLCRLCRLLLGPELLLDSLCPPEVRTSLDDVNQALNCAVSECHASGSRSLSINSEQDLWLVREDIEAAVKVLKAMHGESGCALVWSDGDLESWSRLGEVVDALEWLT